jgi:hypothetical protein
MDIPIWTDAMTKCMQSRYPFMEISTRQCKSSLSGFCVIFKHYGPVMQSSSSSYSRTGIFCAAISILAAVLFMAFSV